jgi:hypothetical protein
MKCCRVKGEPGIGGTGLYYNEKTQTVYEGPFYGLDVENNQFTFNYLMIFKKVKGGYKAKDMTETMEWAEMIYLGEV